MVRWNVWILVSVLCLVLTVSGCMLPVYQLPSGYSSTYHRRLLRHSSELRPSKSREIPPPPAPEPVAEPVPAPASKPESEQDTQDDLEGVFFPGDIPELRGGDSDSKMDHDIRGPGFDSSSQSPALLK